MLKLGKAGLVLALMVALSACSSFDQGPRKAALPASSYEPVPDADQPTLPTDISGGAAQAGVNSGGTYPYGTAQTSGASIAKPSDEVLLRAPDGTLWRKENVDEASYHDDISQCYKYASAQMRHDEMILTDQNAAFDNLATNSAYSQVQSQVQNYDLTKQRKRLVSSCMKSKGYLRQ